MKTLLTFFILLFFLLTSCTSARIWRSDVNPKQITELQKFEPLSYIRLIEEGNKKNFNDSLSLEAKSTLNNILTNYYSSLPKISSVHFENPNLNQQIEKETIDLISQLNTNRGVKGVSITPVIDSVLEANNIRFGFFLVSTGYSIKKNNLGGQLVKTIKTKNLSLGGAPISILTASNASSIVCLLIVDSQENNVTYFRKSFSDGDPTDPDTIVFQFEELLNGFFWK